MFAQTQWSKWSLPSLAAGALWLTAASGLGGLSGLLIGLTGFVLAGVGVSLLLWPGDLRVTEIGALAGIVAAIDAILFSWVLGPVGFVVLFTSALASFWGTGRMAIHLEPHFEGAPIPKPDFKLAARVAVDEALLGFEQFQSGGFALDGSVERIVDDIYETHALFSERGFIDQPATYHLTPSDLSDPEIRKSQARGLEVETLRFESGYEPPIGEPGRARWMGYDACHDAWAYVIRHPGPPRPWMICTNGYRMGFKTIDVSLFERFFKHHGLNVLIPVLPLHGPRRIGWHSGSGFLGLDVVDTIHAEAQAMWDMQRLLSWVRTQDAPRVGATGISLGGYTTALFSSIADGLECTIPGVPVTDFSRIMPRQLGVQQLRYAEHLGYDIDKVKDILRVISPLALEPRVAPERRMIFAATADRLVTPDHIVDLWRHWKEPEIVWYEGTHISFMGERDVWNAVDRTLRDAGMIAAEA